MKRALLFIVILRLGCGRYETLTKGRPRFVAHLMWKRRSSLPVNRHLKFPSTDARNSGQLVFTAPKGMNIMVGALESSRPGNRRKPAWTAISQKGVHFRGLSIGSRPENSFV